MAYFRIQAQDAAQEQWAAKMAELHAKKEKAERNRRPGAGSMVAR